MRSLASLAVLVGCTSSPSPPSHQPSPSPTPQSCAPASSALTALCAESDAIDSMTFASASNINPPPDVNETITGDAARAVYNATLSLHQAPAGPTSCAVDWGVTYTMKFSSAGRLILTAEADPSGCEYISLSGAGLTTTTSYWQTLAEALGVTTSTIWPYSPPP